MPRGNKRIDGSPPRVVESLKIAVKVSLDKFVESDLNEWSYPSSLTSEERAYIHNEARNRGLKSKSRGKGSTRFLTVYKREGSAIMQRDAIVNLSPSCRNVLTNLFSKFPVSTRERQDCLPPSERCKDSHQDSREGSRALGRLAVGSIQIPGLPASNPFQQHRQSLPVSQLQEHIVQTINESQVTIIVGPTGSGKTTQIPQYLLEWHEKMQRPCRIVCSQPRRISAVSVCERVALERGERVGQSVGYQIRLEGKSSPFTVLMYCTSGVLLRSLMASEGTLTSVTHIIVDENHERDRLSDFTLIVLREAVSKYRSLRVILMSATLDAKQYSAYFNNCPVITVPGKSYEVQEYFLEDILHKTSYIDAEKDALLKKLEIKKAQAAALEKWTAAVSQGTAPEVLSEPGSTPPVCYNEIDVALSEAWAFATDSSFAHLLDLVNQSDGSGNKNVDYQHSQTGVTALMVAAARGTPETVELLLFMGANIYVRAPNNYTALDLAKLWSRQEIIETLEAYSLNFETNNTISQVSEANMKQTDEQSRELLELYYNFFDDSFVDYKLLLTLIWHIHMDVNNRGSILIFLPGYDDIIAVRDLLLMEREKLNQSMKITLLMLHSNMQTNEQRAVFRPAANNCRKIILATNIAETSITIEDVVFVIDTGKIKEKSYYHLTGTSSLSTVWISKSCAAQRRGRAGRVQNGVCFRMYSSSRYATMNMYPTPEILRTPLQELCLFAKQLASPNTSIVDFLSKAIDPPSSVNSRSAVTLLKTIDALDTWEDLTDLGHHLVDLPVEPKYGKMLIYAVTLKCLDPVLTIVSCLSYKEIFCLPTVTSPEKKRVATSDRLKFSEGSLSDHLVLLRVFQSWQEAKKQGRGKEFCDKNCVNGATMEMIMGTRSQILSQLRASGFIKAKGPIDIKYVNAHADNWAMVKAALIGGLYPNLARVDREHGVIRTVKEHKVMVHAASALRECGGRKTMADNLPTDWIMYEEMTKVGVQSLIRTATVVSPITVAIFAGPSKIPYDALSDAQFEGSANSDSEEEENEPHLTATLKVDDWATFRTDLETAQLVLQLKVKWFAILSKKLRSNKNVSQVNVEDGVISTIAKVLLAEEQSLGLVQPAGVGKRPYLSAPDFHNSVVNDFKDPTHNTESIAFESNNQTNRSRNVAVASPSRSNHERFSGSSRSFDENTPSSVNFNVGNNLTRYFIIKAGHLKNVELSVIHNVWQFLPLTQNRILQAYKGGRTVILLFNIQGTGQFQGFAKLVGDQIVPPSAMPTDIMGPSLLPIEWIKRGNVPHQQARYLVHHNDFNKLLMNKDGQELDQSVGEKLCSLWDSVPIPWQQGPMHFQRRFNMRSFNNYQMS